MKNAMSPEEFFSELAHHQVSVFDRNGQAINAKAGSEELFGQCLFTDQTCTNPVYIPGDSLAKSISGRQMGELFSRKMSADFISVHFPVSYYPAVYGFASVGSHSTPEEDFVRRKRKKRGIGDIDLPSSR